MWNMKEVVGSWAPGMPSMNRSANCLAINRFGQFMEESCHSSGRNYHTLCAAENFHYGIRDVSDINDFKNATTSNHETIINNDLIHQEQLASLRHIGQVGNVMYFVDDQMVSKLFINIQSTKQIMSSSPDIVGRIFGFVSWCWNETGFTRTTRSI